MMQQIRVAVGDDGLKMYTHKCVPNCILIPASNEPTPPKRLPNGVVVDIRCAEAVLRGANIFAPGILASTSRFETEQMLNIYAVHDIKNTPLKGSIVDREVYTKPDCPDLVLIGSGKALMSRADILKKGSSGIAIEVTEKIVSHPAMDKVLSDSCILQNVPSMVPPILLNPMKGEKVLDMCAAPGGKTAHLADLMQGEGDLIACDRAAKRLEELVSTIKRSKYTNVTPLKFDATKGLKKWEEATFNKILLDPPCSGLGIRPKLTHFIKMKELTEFASYQRKLLSTAAKLLKPGGKLVYSTCTISPLENEGNVAWFLETHEDFQLDLRSDFRPDLYDLASPGLPGTGLSDEQNKNVIRFTPTIESSDTGFFVASFTKADRKRKLGAVETQ
eukprot:TRINITY_DN12387_c0_g1_i4.p1 TRINITY_DN12387_c0_g1~~TRINITY_DN12387_c0_g1_i4.p1  ORF type:complete len:389 (+),score=67.12 TRINITY_DN12387_c0_g1_i4:831-1997(+)